MSYIQVCPQYAKSIQHYATDPSKQFHLTKGEALPMPLYRFADGKERSKKCQDVLFERIGNYKARSTIRASNSDLSLGWTHSDAYFKVAKFAWDITAPPVYQGCETVMVYNPNCEVGMHLRAIEAVVVYNVTVMIEYLNL